MPLITVVIPAYNCAQTIRETVQSVLAQTLTDLEIIIINDGSQDETLDVLSGIADPRIKVFTHDNSGVSVSRNRGIEKATGEFIAFLDSDDLWKPEKLADQYQALQNHPTAAIAYSWIDYIDESGQFLRPGRHALFRDNVYSQLLLGNFIECGSSPLVRKSALTAADGFDESLLTNEDWELWLRLSSQYDFIAVPKVQVLYRISTTSKSFNVQRHEQSRLRIIEQVFSKAPTHLQPLKRQCTANFYKYLLFKVLDAPNPANFRGMARAGWAVKFLWKSIAYNFSLLKQPKLILSSLFKILLVAIFPSKSPKDVIKQLKQTFSKDRHLLAK